MPDFGDTSLAKLPEPRSVEEVAAIAVAVDKQAERRYSACARDLRALGSPAVAALLEELGGEHRTHGGRLEAEAAFGERLDIAAKDLARLLSRFLFENTTADCDLIGLTPYRVLAFAVSLAQRTFKLFSYLAAAADDRVRDYAERLASEELSRAARLRVERRRAYHTGRRQTKAEAYPVARLVETQADLFAAALAIESELAERLVNASKMAPGLLSTCEATCRKVEELRRTLEDLGESGGPVAEELAKFSHSAQADRERDSSPRHLRADCERAFTFYDAVASAPVSEAIMLHAQDLSRAAVERLRQVHASIDEPDETDRSGSNH